MWRTILIIGLCIFLVGCSVEEACIPVCNTNTTNPTLRERIQLENNCNRCNENERHNAKTEP